MMRIRSGGTHSTSIHVDVVEIVENLQGLRRVRAVEVSDMIVHGGGEGALLALGGPLYREIIATAAI